MDAYGLGGGGGGEHERSKQEKEAQGRWVRGQTQFGDVVESIDHLLLYLSGRVETGVHISLHVYVIHIYVY